MDILTQSFSALWQVVAVGILLGAGLPALFALGVRSLNSHQVLVTTTGNPGPSKPTALGMTGAVVCFGVLILAVIFGIVVIVFGKQLFGS